METLSEERPLPSEEKNSFSCISVLCCFWSMPLTTPLCAGQDPGYHQKTAGVENLNPMVTVVLNCFSGSGHAGDLLTSGFTGKWSQDVWRKDPGAGRITVWGIKLCPNELQNEKPSRGRQIRPENSVSIQEEEAIKESTVGFLVSKYDPNCPSTIFQCVF